MRCWKCGSRISEGDLFCEQCGEDQRKRPSDLKECPHCGRWIPRTDGQCPECGYVWNRSRPENNHTGNNGKRRDGTRGRDGVSGTDHKGRSNNGRSNNGGKRGNGSGGGGSKGREKQITIVLGVMTAALLTAGAALTLKIRKDTQNAKKYQETAQSETRRKGVIEGEDQEQPKTERDIVIWKETEKQTEKVTETPETKDEKEKEKDEMLDEFASERQTERQTTPVTEAQTERVTESETERPKVHTYQIVRADCTWEEAYRYCRDRGGYLARIESEEEFNQITRQIDAEKIEKIQLYIGMRRDPGTSGYYLVDDNNVLYGNRLDSGYTSWLSSIWLPGEPSYRDESIGMDEYYVDLFRYGDDKRWVINDIPNDLIGALADNRGKVGYICEFEN